MAKRSMKSRAMVVGIILGVAVTGRKVIGSLWRAANQTGPAAGTTTQKGPANAAGNETAGSAPRQDGDLGRAQHGDLGGVPPVDDANSLLMGGSAARADAGNLAGASAYSSDSAPYDADVSEEGVTLTYEDPTDREGDVPLDEGIPNLGEPGDVEDVGPETMAQEDIVEDVEVGVPEEYGEAEPIDSIEYGDAWVADAPGEEDEIPSASRGLREYGEGDEDEQEIEDTDDTELLGLYEDTEPSGTGGEVDLENDEAPQFQQEGFSIVADPNDPLSADAGGTIVDPLAPEETLGLRDSESQNAPPQQPADEGQSRLGVTGDYDEAAATQRLQASAGEADTSGDAGADRQASFTTGNRGHEGVDDTGTDRAMEDQEYGQTGEFGAPVPNEAGPPIETDTSNRNVGSTGKPREADAAPDVSEKPEDDEHLGISGDFDEAEDTEKIPAKPSDGDESSEQSDPGSYVTGDDAGQQEASSSTDEAGYSAAWSTSSGVVDEWPNQAAGAKGFPGEHAGQDDAATGDAERVARDTSDTTGGKTAGESGQIASEAKDRAGMASEMSSSHDKSASDQAKGASEEYPGDPSGGDVTDMAAAAAGDLGAATPVAGGLRRQEDEGNPPSTNPASGGAEDAATSNAPGTGAQGVPRKSRKQRRMEATDWIPAGAVKGDGTANCPADYPIKGNANSRIYHRPEDPSYPSTIPEYCFATEDDAKRAGFRAPKG